MTIHPNFIALQRVTQLGGERRTGYGFADESSLRNGRNRGAARPVPRDRHRRRRVTRA
jgi:hypothetical protein